MSEQDNVAIVREAYNNFKTGNITGLLNLLSDDITWRLPEIEDVPFSGTRKGRDAVGEFFAILGTNQEALTFEPRETVAQGEKVVSLGTYRWHVKSTNREYACDFAHVFTIGGGKVTDFLEFTDTAAAANAYRKAMSA